MQVVIAFQGTKDAHDQKTNFSLFPESNEPLTAKLKPSHAKHRISKESKESSRRKAASEFSRTTVAAPQGKQHGGWKKSWQSVKDVIVLQVGIAHCILALLGVDIICRAKHVVTRNDMRLRI